MTSIQTTDNINMGLGYGCYAVAAYQFFQFSLFTGNVALYFPSLKWLFPNSIDDNLHILHPNAKWEWQLDHPMINNVFLMILYGTCHSVLARSWLKAPLRRYTSFWFERLMFILFNALTFSILTFYWKPFTGIVMWNFLGNPVGSLMHGVYLASLAWIGLTLWYTAVYDLFDFRKAFGEIGVPAGIPYNLPPVYRLNRQPLFFGLLLSFWATPKMTLGHCVFSLFMTLYTLKSVQFQERDAKAKVGAKFVAYQNSVPLYYLSFNNLFNELPITTFDDGTQKKDIPVVPASPIDVHSYQHINRR